MFKYIVKRILIFIPTLLVISLVTFMLSTSVPGDPVEQMLNSNSEMGSSANAMASEKAYIDKREQLGLDLPVFYFSFSNKATPDNLHEIPKKFHRQNLSRLVDVYGNWDYINPYYNKIRDLELAVSDTKRDSTNGDALIEIRDNVQKMYLNYDAKTLNVALKNIQNEIGKFPSLSHLGEPAKELQQAYNAMTGNPSVYKKYIPAIHWYGTNNQYHKWFTKFLKGDFGISYQDGRPVKNVLWDAVRWTVMLSILSIILTYLISIPLGIISASKKDGRRDQTISTFLFMLYSLPNFWVATLLILFFGGGDFLGWFPAYGVGEVDSSMGIGQVIGTRAYHLIMPMICFTYGGLAFLYRQMRGAMITTLSQDYIRTARAKGLEEKEVLWKHAFKNSLLPIITLFASVFPLAISGSIVIEIIFSIPGMGKLAYEALVARNYPIVYTVVMFSAILTLVGYLVADILYAVVDPRISYSKK